MKKVSKEIDYALKQLHKHKGIDYSIKFFYNYTKGRKFWVNDYLQCLKGLSFSEFVELMLFPYEIELTPEEKTLDLYNMCSESKKAIISEILDIHDIKVVGIND